MLWLGLTLTALALALLILGLRGRVIARGTFCRKCRFDLAGLDAAGACPECGATLDADKATKSHLRRRSPWLVAVAVLLLAGGIALPIAGGRITTTNLYQKTPAWLLLPMERLGFDGALTQIAVRSRSERFSDANWEDLIARALAHQADRSVPWDPRWGDVLAEAIADQRLNEQQLAAYFRNGITTVVTFRTQIPADAKWLPVNVSWIQDRIHRTAPMVWSGPASGRWTGLSVEHAFGSTGVVGLAQTERDGGGDLSTDFFVPWAATNSNTMSTRVLLRWDPGGQPPDQIKVFIETRTIVREGSIPQGSHQQRGPVLAELGPHRVEQMVTVLPPGTPVVSMITDETAAADIRSTAQLSTLFLPTDEHPEARYPASLQIRLSAPTTTAGGAISGTLYLINDGAEHRLGSASVPNGASITVSINPLLGRPQQDTERLESLLNAAANRGQADFVFRSDVNAATNDALIDKVVDVTLRFNDVPVIAADTPPPKVWINAAPEEE
ncbi:MAG: hypothetical protein D6692_11465 [Planctomycetota bacterium]|nr:MAG: hypothetical protein D6692_11465 [Planctomycetota bacterium]